MSTKRVIELASKLQLAQNERLRSQTAIWVSESKDWASLLIKKYGLNDVQANEEGYRLLYIMNRFCPALYQFHPLPDPKQFGSDIEGCRRAMVQYGIENTPVELRDKNGQLIQEGVEYNAENFAAFIAEAAKYCNLDEGK